MVKKVAVESNAVQWNNDAPDVPSLDWTVPKLIECALEANAKITQYEKMTSVVPTYFELGALLRILDFHDNWGEGIASRTEWGEKYGVNDTRMSRAIAIARHFRNTPMVKLQHMTLNDAIDEINAVSRGPRKESAINPVRRLSTIKKAIEGLPEALMRHLATESNKWRKQDLLKEWIGIYRVLLDLQSALEGNKIVDPVKPTKAKKDDGLLAVVPETIDVK